MCGRSWAIVGCSVSADSAPQPPWPGRGTTMTSSLYCRKLPPGGRGLLLWQWVVVSSSTLHGSGGRESRLHPYSLTPPCLVAAMCYLKCCRMETMSTHWSVRPLHHHYIIITSPLNHCKVLSVTLQNEACDWPLLLAAGFGYLEVVQQLYQVQPRPPPHSLCPIALSDPLTSSQYQPACSASAAVWGEGDGTSLQDVAHSPPRCCTRWEGRGGLIPTSVHCQGSEGG